MPARGARIKKKFRQGRAEQGHTKSTRDRSDFVFCDGRYFTREYGTYSFCKHPPFLQDCAFADDFLPISSPTAASPRLDLAQFELRMRHSICPDWVLAFLCGLNSLIGSRLLTLDHLLLRLHCVVTYSPQYTYWSIITGRVFIRKYSLFQSDSILSSEHLVNSFTSPRLIQVSIRFFTVLFAQTQVHLAWQTAGRSLFFLLSP